MKVQLETSTTQNVIRAYSPGQVTVNQETYQTSLIVMPDRLIADWPPRQLTELTEAHMQAIVELRPEVILLGTGLQLQFPASQVIRTLVHAQIGFEAMDTGAACRTYNVLMSEGRRVAAALLLGEPGKHTSLSLRERE